MCNYEHLSYDSTLFLQSFVSCPIQPPLQRHSNRTTRHFINSPHGSSIVYSPLVNEMNLETVLEVAYVCERGKKYASRDFVAKCLNLLPAFNYHSWRGQNHVLFSLLLWVCHLLLLKTYKEFCIMM